ncbi:Prefoldin subunit 6 [Rhodotorula kratochvilovae]
MASLEAKLQAASSSYAKLETDYARAVESRQRLDAQKTENEGVKKELANLTDKNSVYKLVGPILMKQEQAEARSNVDKRLEWIGGEITRVEASLKDLETKLESKKMEIVHLQGQYQQQQQGTAAAGSAPLAAAAA